MIEYNSFDRASTSLDDDIFYINDIQLRIPPIAITVEKKFYNNNYQTLRTQSSRQLKSGYAQLAISINTAFKVSNFTDQDNLRKIAAGLQATPFCVVKSNYLENLLGSATQSNSLQQNNNKNSYNEFQPIMLALSSMTFSTTEMPDVVSAQFEFLYFNYLPFTPTIQFKGGENFDKPVTIDECKLWKYFYQPFLDASTPVNWPHRENDFDARKTSFIWREYAQIPKTSTSSNKAAIGLAKIIEKSSDLIQQQFQEYYQKQEPKEEFKGIGLEGTIPPDVNQITEEGYEVILKNFIRSQKKTPELEELSFNLQNSNGTISSVAGDLFDPIAKEYYKIWKNNKQETNIQQHYQIQNAAKNAILELNKRIKSSTKDEDLDTKTGFEKLDNIEAIFSNKVKKTDLGSFSLYGRKRKYEIIHNNNNLNPSSVANQEQPSSVIEDIVISFQNILPTIPVSNYQYATIQHVGSIDAYVIMKINSNIAGAKDINEVLDSVETVARNFKQIPQGFLNLYIKNDFLKLFGIEEVVSEGIRVQNLMDQPGRCEIVMNFIRAGITSKTVIEDKLDLLQQEGPGTANTENFNETVFKTIERYLVKSGFSNPITNSLFWLKASKGILESAGSRYETTNIKRDGTQDALANIVDRTRDQINKVLERLVTESYGILNRDRNYVESVYAILFSEKLEQVTQGKIPGLALFRSHIRELQKVDPQNIVEPELRRAVRNFEEQNFSRLAVQGFSAEFDPTLSNDQIVKKYEKVLNNIGSSYFIEMISKIGLEEYIKNMRLIINDVLYGPAIHLPEFREAKELFIKNNNGVEEDGVFCYNDFKEQIQSIISNTSTNIDSSSNKNLIKYDPDCYFWYTKYNGGGISDIDSVIPLEARVKAQAHSQAIAQNGWDAANKFFSGVYKTSLQSFSNTEVFKDINKEKIGVLDIENIQRPYLENESFSNATRWEKEEDSKTDIFAQVLDDKKRQINLPKKGELIRSPNQLIHTTNPFLLWNGTQGGVAQQSVAPDQQRSSSSEPSGPYEYGVSEQKNNTTKFLPIYKATVRPNFIWPVKNMRQKKIEDWDQSKRFLAARDVKNGIGSRQHKGIDIVTSTNDLTGPGGDPIYAVADGRVLTIKDNEKFVNARGGIQITIQHGDYIVTYSHNIPGSVNNIFKNKEKINGAYQVKQGEIIALMGRSGVNASTCQTHLHIQFQHKSGGFTNPFDLLPPLPGNVQRYTPSSAQTAISNNIALQTRGTDVLSSTLSPLQLSIDEYEKDYLNGQGQGLMRAYPTFKLYFIEEDAGERKRLLFDDFFSYNAVKSIRVVRNREIAADLCYIELTNISGTLSNRKFRQNYRPEQARDFSGKISNETNTGFIGENNKENPIASLLLQEGAAIELKLGYSSDPERLETVFIGKITEVEFLDGDILINIIAQSYAIELIQDIKGIDKPIKKTSKSLFSWDFFGFWDGAATGRIIEELLAQPEVTHFGRWEPAGQYSSGTTLGRDLLTNRWTFTSQPQDDNIFCPSPRSELKDFGSGTIISDIFYIIYRTTIWDICQEMTYRHPNFIAQAVPYKDLLNHRMTFYFGLPNQLYFARSPNLDERDIYFNTESKEKEVQERIKKEETNRLLDRRKYIENAIASGDRKNQEQRKRELNEINRIIKSTSNAKILVGNTVKINSEERAANITKQRQLAEAKKGGWIKPFRNYHLITSAQHIILNNITANQTNVANTVVIEYPDKNPFGSLEKKTELSSEIVTEIVKIDSALPDEDMKMEISSWINLDNRDLAKRYGIKALMKNVGDLYKGEIVIIGNPKIKPNDCVYLFDTDNDMIGVFEVAEVQHSFNQEQGFRTEIKPKMFVQSSDWSILSAAEAMGVVFEYGLHNALGLTPQGNLAGGDVLDELSFGGTVIGKIGGFLGGFGLYKLLDFTQHAQPLIITPMLHRGRIFAGGYITKKIPTSIWSTVFSDWTSLYDKGYYRWWEDVKDSWLRRLNIATFQETQGNFWQTFGEDE